MSNPIGLSNYLQTAREATYGVDLAATHRIGVRRFGFTPDAGIIEDMVFTGSANEPAPLQGLERCTGFIETDVDFENLLLLYDLGYGTSTYGSQGGTDGGSGPSSYTHTFNDSKLLFNSHVFELGEANVPATKVAQALGSKATKMSFAWRNDGNPGVFRLEFVGQVKSRNVTPTGALSVQTRYPAFFQHITAIDNGLGDSASDRKITSVELVIENPLVAEHTGTSGRYIDEPILGGRRRTTLTLVQRRMTKSAEDAYQAKTALAPSFTLTNGTRSMVFTFPAAYLQAAPDTDYGDFGVVSQTLVYKCTDGGSYASQLVVTNSEATIATP